MSTADTFMLKFAPMGSVGIADLAEGVPPEFILDWLPGYFYKPACFWVAFQLIGKNPDFCLGRTWGWYGLFVLILMSIEPQLRGYICSEKFTSEISYRNITPALFFTTAITWIIAPVAMLVALPLVKKLGLFWAEIPGHVKERKVGQKNWIWQSGNNETLADVNPGEVKLPFSIFLAAPFIVMVLALIIWTAWVTMHSAEILLVEDNDINQEWAV